MSIKQKSVAIGIISIIAILFIVLIGPLDYFTHGYYSESIDFNVVAPDIVSIHDFEKLGTYEMLFSPKQDHFVGFEIILFNQPEGNTGCLFLEVQSEDGKTLDTIKVDLSKVVAAEWYKTYTKANLNKEKIYKLVIYAEKCDTTPYLLIANSDYLEESVEGDLLIAYAYAMPTFTFQNKVIICLFIFAVWLFLISIIFNRNNGINYLRHSSCGLFIVALLTWNFMYNSMDNQNSLFDGFQNDSESLVKGVIEAEKNGTWFIEKYGLGRYYSSVLALTDNMWIEGYSRNEAAVVVANSDYTRRFSIIGNYIKFKNGEALKITNVIDDGSNMVIYLDSNRTLNPYKYGDLKEAVYCDADKNQIALLNNGRIDPYTSQFGLQGKVFRHLARYMDEDNLYSNLNLLCCIALGVVFAIITVLINMKYNMLLSATFLCTFWLSPWIVSFARNLYWVEFTWFIPMAIGLFCAWKIEKRLCRIVSYCLTVISILGKCLCGYEYISVIMMGLISFLLVDFAMAIVNKNRERRILLFRTIMIIGISALLGFGLALCIHAQLKGTGNILDGIKAIVEQDVLRRTSGADLNEFDSVYWPSFNASIWETFSKYFHFHTEVITGISGNLFPVLCIMPITIFAYDIRKGKPDYEIVIMYIVFFLSSISWFCLAKGHSYIHTHLNYVLWYFGFVQICVYSILRKIAIFFNNSSISKKK